METVLILCFVKWNFYFDVNGSLKNPIINHHFATLMSCVFLMTLLSEECK